MAEFYCTYNHHSSVPGLPLDSLHASEKRENGAKKRSERNSIDTGKQNILMIYRSESINI